MSEKKLAQNLSADATQNNASASKPKPKPELNPRNELENLDNLSENLKIEKLEQIHEHLAKALSRVRQ